MRISDWSSDVCSSDLVAQHVELLLRLALDVDVRTAVAALGITEHAAQRALADRHRDPLAGARDHLDQQPQLRVDVAGALLLDQEAGERTLLGRQRGKDIVRHGELLDGGPAIVSFARPRSEEHTSELQSLMRNSYAVFRINKKNTHIRYTLN